jgi:hypothetical protein
MRDLTGLLTSLTNVTRDQLLAILRAEAEAAEQTAKSSLSRTAKQRSRQREAIERPARLEHMISYFKGAAPQEMPAGDLTICRALEQRLHS